MHPKSSFREHLRADIYELSVKKEERFFRRFLQKVGLPMADIPFHPINFPKPFSWSQFLLGGFQNIGSVFRHPLLVWPGLAMATVLLVPLLFSPAVEHSIAMKPTLLQNFSGEVFVDSNGYERGAEDLEELFSGQIITTAEGSFAEISFFEGSLLRMDENTTIEIISLSPHTLFSDAGAVEVMVKTGRVWGTTFQNAKSGLGMVVKTSGSEIFPERSSFDVAILDGKTKVRIFSRSALLHVSGVQKNAMLSVTRLQEVVFSPFEDPQLSFIANNVLEDQWITVNQQKDEEYKTKMLEMMTARMQEKLLISDFSDGIQGFFDRKPTDEEVSLLFSRLNDALIVASAGDANLAETSLQDISDNLDLLEGIEEINADMAEGITISSALLQEHTLPPSAKPFKGAIIATAKKVSPVNTPVPAPTAEVVYENFQTDAEPENTPKDLQGSQNPTTQDILAEKRQHFYDSAADSFRHQIEIYTIESSRINQAQYLLQKIDNTSNNVALLRTLQRTAPADIKPLIRKKIRQIEYEQ